MSVYAKLMALSTALIMALAGIAQAQDGYRIRAGDVLRIEVLEDPELNRAVLVTPDGQISFPLAGTVRAQGRSVGQIQSTVSARLASNFAVEPTVFVAVQQVGERRASGPAAPDTIDIFLVGEANTQGKLTVEHGTTLLQAFGQMGGFTRFAATKRIQLRRVQDGREKVTVYNYDAIVTGASSGGTTHLRDGDVILVPQRRLFE